MDAKRLLGGERQEHVLGHAAVVSMDAKWLLGRAGKSGQSVFGSPFYSSGCPSIHILPLLTCRQSHSLYVCIHVCIHVFTSMGLPWIYYRIPITPWVKSGPLRALFYKCIAHANEARRVGCADNTLRSVFKHPRQRAEATYMPVSR